MKVITKDALEMRARWPSLEMLDVALHKANKYLEGNFFKVRKFLHKQANALNKPNKDPT